MLPPSPLPSVCLFLAVSVCGFSGEPAPRVDIPGLGAITGRSSGGDIPGSPQEFLGIPYAYPPVGSLRWKPPVLHNEPWAPTVRRADAFGKSCLQGPFNPSIPPSTQSEACLFLNVYRPGNASNSSNLPVLFWVHGGGFQGGSGNESRLDGRWLVTGRGVDAIVVTINYR